MKLTYLLPKFIREKLSELACNLPAGNAWATSPSPAHDPPCREATMAASGFVFNGKNPN